VSERPIPVLSSSTSSCIATIPISAKASRPIHTRPRISLSSTALLETRSNASTVRSAMPGACCTRARSGRGRGWEGRAGRCRGSAMPGAG
jgi:hypothetical protein